MGFTVERNGFTSVHAIATAIIKDLTANGFVPKYFNKGTTSDVGDAILATKATFESGPLVDPLMLGTLPLSETQPWRLMINGAMTVSGKQALWIAAGTPLQFPDNGSCYTDAGDEIVTVPLGADEPQVANHLRIKGLLGKPDPVNPGYTEATFISQADINPAIPWSYRISITDRGFALECWQNAPVGVRKFCWVAAQRLVNPISGETFITNHAPVIALYSIKNSAEIYKVVVRENDVLAPSKATIVSANSDYVNGVINPAKQISLAETNQYYITFPAGFNTDRHLYNEELDILAFTSAGVLSQYNDAVINVYGHAEVPFGAGGYEVHVGDIVHGAVSGARGIVKEIKNVVGDWTGTPNAIDPTYLEGTTVGSLVLHSTVGAFVNDEILKVGATGFAKSTDASALINRTYKGGNANFSLDAEGMRILILIQGGGI